MPSIPRRPGRRSFYLDTSTLSDAFRGVDPNFLRGSDPPACVDLGKAVTKIASEANLCLTTMHIMEFARNEDRKFGDAIIRWIDALDTVWMRGMHHVAEDEDEVALQCALGFEPRTKVVVFAPSMLSAFGGLKMRELADALADGNPLLKVFAAARIHGGKAQEVEMRKIIRTFHFDRHEDPSTRDLTPTQKASIVDGKLRDTLKIEAQEAYARLRLSHETTVEFHNRCRSQLPAHFDVFVDYVLANPTKLPSFHVTREYSTRWPDRAAAKKPGSKKALAEESSFYDHAHMAIGAAYCDVFTCDRRTAQCFGSSREELGFRPAYTMSGDGLAFAEALSKEPSH